jgi:hypothetical protein
MAGCMTVILFIGGIILGFQGVDTSGDPWHVTSLPLFLVGFGFAAAAFLTALVTRLMGIHLEDDFDV